MRRSLRDKWSRYIVTFLSEKQFHVREPATASIYRCRRPTGVGFTYFNITHVRQKHSAEVGKRSAQNNNDKILQLLLNACVYYRCFNVTDSERRKREGKKHLELSPRMVKSRPLYRLHIVRFQIFAKKIVKTTNTHSCMLLHTRATGKVTAVVSTKYCMGKKSCQNQANAGTTEEPLFFFFKQNNKLILSTPKANLIKPRKRLNHEPSNET